MFMLQHHLACSRPTIELLTVSNFFQADNNEINFLQELL